MVVIGEDTSERLDVIPAQFRVIVTRRPKLACRACAGTVVQQPAPPRLIEGGIPTETLVAHVLVARYADHLPLYRQAQMLARQHRRARPLAADARPARLNPCLIHMREHGAARQRMGVTDAVSVAYSISNVADRSRALHKRGAAA